jgi:hypothetical protein
MLLQHKPELLRTLAPENRYVTLKPDARTGQVLTLPVEALRLAWLLEARGIVLQTDADHQLVVPRDARLTKADHQAIARWHWHLAAIAEYQAPEVS